MAPYPIDGLPVEDNSWPVPKPMPLRREIDEWFDNEPEQVSLFLQAVARLQTTPQSEQLSFFKVAGIHYLPSYTWTGDDEVNERPTSENYCTHSSVKFGTWHRPYMALLEQLISKNMLDIASEFSDASDQEKYTEAANNWRLPFWDWGLKKTRNGKTQLTIPKILDDQYRKISVYQPSGLTKTIDNPLQKYGFNPEAGDESQVIDTGAPWQNCQATIRHASDWNPRDPVVVQEYLKGVQNNQSIIDALNAPGENFQQRIYDLLQMKDNYNAFITNISDPRYPQSLEGVHNSVHNYCGGNGHMSFPEIAAFDPIFWFHHCNVDRVMALWQELNEDAWWTSVTERRRRVTPASLLTPFRHTDGDDLPVWDSNGVRRHFTFGYSYPVLEPWDYVVDGELDRPAYKKAIQSMIGRNYGPLQRKLWQKRGLDIGPPSSISAQSAQIALAAVPPPAPVPDPATEPEQPQVIEFDHYVADVSFEKYALQGGQPFNVIVFLGKFNKDPVAAPGWIFEENIIGSIYNFVTPIDIAEGSCANCRSQYEDHLVISGRLPLTSAILDLVEKGEIPDVNDRAAVTEYLTNYLTWRVATPAGVDVPREVEDLESLNVSVSRTKARSPNVDGLFTEIGDYEIIYEITENKSRGARRPA